VLAIRVAPTGELDAAELAEARALCDAAFDGTFSDPDWEHALGGLHALALEGPLLVGHAALVARRLLHGGRSLRTGYVEAVAVPADRRRQGVGAAMMHALDRYLLGGFELGALASSEVARAFYKGLGWQVWPGPTAVLGPDGVRPTPDEDGGIFVRPISVRLDPAVPLVCDWRNGDVW